MDRASLADRLSDTKLSHTFRIWLYTSDNGPDQSSMRRNHMRRKLQHSANECIIDDNCNLHQLQIVIKNALLLIDYYLKLIGRSWKYYATVAKLSHLWRNNARSVFTGWNTMHGATSALQYAKALPPKPIAGRWGLITRSEDKLFAAPAAVLYPVLCSVLFDNAVVAPMLAVCNIPLVDDAGMLPVPAGVHQPQQATPPSANAPAPAIGGSEAHPAQTRAITGDNNNPDECRLEAQAAYRMTMSRWKSEVAAAITDPLFQPITVIARQSRQPLDHVLRFYQTNITGADLNRMGGHTAQLQAGKADEIIAGFDKVLDTMDVETLIAELPSDLKGFIVNMAFHAVLQSEASLQRRIFRKLHEHASQCVNMCFK